MVTADHSVGDSDVLNGVRQAQLEPWLVTAVEFVLAETKSGTTPMVPEISLRLASDSVVLWDKIEREANVPGAGPPYWAFAWAGGQALARYLLDNPAVVSRRRVLDVASGSGLIGIAAKRAGAARVMANDIDSLSAVAIALNAAANDVAVEVNATDLLGETSGFDPSSVDVVLVGDGFYDHGLSPRMLAFARRCHAAGCTVLVGDPGREDLPIAELTPVKEYLVPVTRDCQHTAAAKGPGEQHDLRRATVWTFEG
jgi:predicted nicotinamide N-methyase